VQRCRHEKSVIANTCGAANLLIGQSAARTLGNIATETVISLRLTLVSKSSKEPYAALIGNWRRGLRNGTHKGRSISTALTAAKKQTTHNFVIANAIASFAIGQANHLNA
jgi:hypothetical protein